MACMALGHRHGGQVGVDFFDHLEHMKACGGTNQLCNIADSELLRCGDKKFRVAAGGAQTQLTTRGQVCCI